MKEDDVFDKDVEFDLKIYGKRWWIALLLGFDSLILRILKNSLGIVNDVYTAYFKISRGAVDWFTLVQVPGMIFTCILLAPTIFNQLIGQRKLTLAMSGSMTFSCCCLLAAYAIPLLYPLIFVGEFLIGFVVITMDVVCASFAIKWFPEHQVGLALSVKGISGNIGSLLAYLIPTNLLISPIRHNNSIHFNSNFSQSINQTFETKEWFSTNQFRLIVFTSVLLLFSFVVWMFLIQCASDRPPKPPTIAQATVQAKEKTEETKHTSMIPNMKEFYYEIQRILKSKLIVQLALILSIAQGCNFIQKLLMGEMLRKMFNQLNQSQQANVLSGYVLVLFEVGCIFGSVVSGKVVDRCKNYHVQLMIDLLFCFVSVVGIFLGFHYCNAVLLFVSNTLFGFFITFLVTPVFEIMYQHMYPSDTGFLTLMLRIEGSIGVIVIGQSCRFLLDFCGRTGVLLFLSSLLLLSFIVSLFVKPSYNRLAMSKLGFNDPDEKTSLISEKS